MPELPATGESLNWSSSKPSDSAFSRTLSSAARRRFSSVTLPPFTLPPGSSNCGLTSTTPSAPSRRRKANPRSMERAATKLTSTLKKSNGPGASPSDSFFQSTPSRLVTRGSSRSDGWQLAAADVDRGHVGRAVREQRLGEAAGRRAHVDGTRARDRARKQIERGPQLEAATADGRHGYCDKS